MYQLTLHMPTARRNHGDGVDDRVKVGEIYQDSLASSPINGCVGRPQAGPSEADDAAVSKNSACETIAFTVSSRNGSDQEGQFRPRICPVNSSQDRR